MAEVEGITGVTVKCADISKNKRWSMWFNSMQREEPYRGLTYYEFFGDEKV